jgi:HEAT repeat protein
MSRSIRASNIIKLGSAIFCIFAFLPTVSYSQSAAYDFVNRLIPQLKDEDPISRARAAGQIKEIVALYPEEIKNTDAVEALILLVRNDKNTDTRRKAAGIIGEIGDARSTQTLMAGLEEFNLDIIAGAYRFFIRKGKPGTEDVLIRALSPTAGFDREIAEAFLNSGNSKLEKVAREWAESHSFKIFMFPGGSKGPRWGSSR